MSEGDNSRRRVSALIIALDDVLRYETWIPFYLRQVIASLGTIMTEYLKN